MNFRIALFFMLWLCTVKSAYSQVDNNIMIENIIESIAEYQSEDFDYTELTETLNKYYRNPININKTNKNQLQELMFLNPIQIRNLLQHIENQGQLIDILELQSIDGYDLETIRILLNFVSINQPSGFENFSLSNLKKSGKHDILMRYGRVFQQQKGFSIPETSDRTRYLGSPYRFFTGYRFSFQNNVQFSLNIEKDAGEQLWNNAHNAKGFDFASASLFIKDLRKFKKIVIGDFALQFGQGLTLWSGLSFGKSADIFSVTKQDLGLRSYTSVNEYSFFRGVATQISFGKFDFTPFLSSIKLDASSDIDTDGNIVIGSLQQTGFHRTSTEIANKNKVLQSVYGGNIQYNNRDFSIGLTAYQTNYNFNFAAADEPYKVFNYTGKQLQNVGLYYNKTFHNIYFFGEFAHSIQSGKAFINGAVASLSPQVSLVVFHRNYDRNYHSFFNQAISENTNAVNEKGFYGGLQFKSGRKYEFNFYADVFKFPWLKFRVDAPSNGHEIFSQFNYSPNKKTRFSVRYKLEEKELNILKKQINALETSRKQNYRIEIQHQLNKSLTLRNRAEIVQYKRSHSVNTYGFLVYQDVRYHPLSSKISGNIRFALFDTEGFDTRIYTYENDVLYAFAIPGFQNKGSRFYINGRYKLSRKLDSWLKYSITKYTDTTRSIGSGLETIDGNIRSEIKIQLRYHI